MVSDLEHVGAIAGSKRSEYLRVIVRRINLGVAHCCARIGTGDTRECFFVLNAPNRKFALDRGAAVRTEAHDEKGDKNKNDGSATGKYDRLLLGKFHKRDMRHET